VLAAHYAEPLDLALTAPAALRVKPSTEADVIAELAAGTPFAMLENSRGWAWGYAGADRRVGYLPSAALSF
jgi:hypothetical protein